jgi:glycosyltransferase A (GT-A) superfamily protein (DUF2064 family)
MAMLRDVADAARTTSCDERILFWSSATQPRHLEAIFEGFAFVRQSEGSLGDRMSAAFGHASERGDAVVLIGSDAPLLGSDELDAAFRVLESSALALCPAFDGGFCLIGVQRAFVRRLPVLFHRVEWGSGTVFEKVLSNYLALRRGDDAFSLLPMTFDVDTPDDLSRLRVQIRARETAGQRVPRHLEAFFDALS